MKIIMQRMIAGILSLSILLTSLPLTAFAQNSVLYGDINKSGVVDQSDVNSLKKYLAEYDIEIDTKAADVNLDNTVDLQDLLLIEKYVAGFDVVLGDNVKIIFDTDGGSVVNQVMLCNGAILTDIMEEPVTEKEGYIFTGWLKEDGKPFYAEQPVTTNLNLKAKFEVLDSSVEETPISFALEDQSPNMTYHIISSKDLTVDEVVNKLSLLATDGSEPIELSVIKVNSKSFTVSAKGGFHSGCTYELTLNDGLYFKDKSESIRKATFMIHKDEVDNLKYNEEVKYIKDTDKMSYTLDGSSTPLPVLDIALISSGQKETVSGSFDYEDGGLTVGETLCIYETVDPRSRDYVANDYEEDSVAFIKVTGVEGTTIQFKGLEETQATDVIFMPDTIPFSVPTLPTLDSSTIDSGSYDTDAWSFMGHSGAPKFDVGDFVVLYQGKFEDMTDTSPVYFGEVTGVAGTTITFKKTTAKAIEAANDVFLSNPLSGDDLLKNVDTDSVEKKIEKQAIDSGFAGDAVEHLIKVAAKTDHFKDMSLENVTVMDGEGNPLSKSQLNALASKASAPKINVTAKISKDPTNFKDGIRLELSVDAEFSIGLDDGDMKFLLHATFVEEIYVKVNLKSYAHVKWYLFVPVLDELTFGASTDIKNYTSIAIDLRIYTVQGDKAALWDQFKNFQTKYKDTLNKIKELEQKIEEANDSKEKQDSYQQTIKNLWKSLPAGAQAIYNGYCDELGEVNMSSVLNRLLKSTSEEETDAGVQDLMNRYSKMMKTETSWVTLVEKNIFEIRCGFLGGLVAVSFKLDFVIKANVNISIGISMDYLVGKRYTFWIDIIHKTSGSSVTDLTDEKFAFKFYVMGYIGLKMGVKATVSLEVLWGLAGMGISGEFGPYIKLWGYFIYTYTKMRPANTNTWDIDSQMAGALYLEFGIYITISFNVDVIKKTVYNPDLYDKEFPLLTAGVRNNVYRYGYTLDEDEVVVVKDQDNNSNNGIDMMLPDSFRLMQYIDLVEGNIEKSVYDYSNFVATLSNSNFKFDSQSGKISVSVPEDVRYMKCNLTLTWKQGKLSFSTRDLRIVIPLVWTNLSNSELKEKYTVTVNVGNERDGYIPLWSQRVIKNESYNLPAKEEVLGMLNYSDYNFGDTNLKYDNIAGYGTQQTKDLTTYSDTSYYFTVDYKEYNLPIHEVQSANGNTSTVHLKANFGDKFKLGTLQNSGADDYGSGKFTCYYNTVAKNQDGGEISSDIGRAIDISFAKELLNGTTYTAVYVDNSIAATYKFEGDISDIADKSVKIKRGTTPPDIFTKDITDKKAVVKSVSPKIGNILSNTTYTVISKIKPIIMRTINYETNGGSTMSPIQIPEESIIALPTPPTKSGYTFMGWYSDSSFQNIFNMENMPSHDLTLYARWEGDINKITFDANAGTLPNGTTNPISVKNGAIYGTLPVPTRANYQFMGWYTERTGGSQISQGDTVYLLDNILAYARWTEKSVINPTSVRCTSQNKTYNQNHQPVTFSVPDGIVQDSFSVSYMRQGMDSEWSDKAVNAGTYNIKITRPEDGEYKAFEKVISGVYTIDKAPSSILKAPSCAGVYYGNITPTAMSFGTDYIGERIEYAASTSRSVVPSSGWSGGAAYNIYDSNRNNIDGTRVYLWARINESENYLPSTISMVSDQPIDIVTKPKALVSPLMGGSVFNYIVWIQTSKIDKAGTDAKISVKIGNGAYQQLDKDNYNDFEKGDLDAYGVSIDPSMLYNTCGGTIPITLKYEESGSSPAWHCAWLRLDMHKNYGQTPIIKGNQQDINHWFGANEYNSSVVEETYYLTGYDRLVDFGGTFSQDDVSMIRLPSSSNYNWEWESPSITESIRGVSYNPYEFINAPELTVSFNNQKYNRFITQGVKSFSIENQALYNAMIADGVPNLDLTYTLEFKPLNGISSVGGIAKRSKTIKVTTEREQKSTSSRSVSTGLMSADFGNQLDSRLSKITSDIEIGKNGTFDVSYSLDQNLGIWGGKFAVNYDKTKVNMTGYTLGELFTADEVTEPQAYDNGRYVFLGSRDDFIDTTTSGKLVTLHFKMKEGVVLSDYPVSLDTTASQFINGESGVVSPIVTVSAPKINAKGNLNSVLDYDNVTLSVFAGNDEVKSVRVQKDNAAFTDITPTYSQGYRITENGTYTFELTTTGGDIASTSITYTKLDSVKKGEQSALSFDSSTPTVKTYGDTSFRIGVTGGSGNGAISYEVVSGPATISGNTVTITGVGSVIVRATKGEDKDYNEKTVQRTITVTKKQVTITGVSAENKTYDGNTTAAISGGATVMGVENGDTLCIVNGTAAFSSKDVGRGKIVTFTEFYLSGADADKYTLASQPKRVTADITAKPIMVQVKIHSKAYDGVNNADISEAVIRGEVSGDFINLVAPYPLATFVSEEASNDIEVKFGGEFKLGGKDAQNYTLIQPHTTGNITNNYKPVQGTDYIVSNTGWGNTDFVVTAQNGFELSMTNSVGGVWSDTITRREETDNGSITFFVRNKGTGAISLTTTEHYQIDKTAPSGDIKIGTSSIKKALNAITFGLFFQKTQNISITSKDIGSGVKSVQYKLSSTVLDEKVVRESSDWVQYTKAFQVAPDSQTVVYVKITDIAGNVLYLGSDGLVLDGIAPVISGITNGKVYCNAVTVMVTDTNLDTLKVNDTAVKLIEGKLTLSPSGKTQTVIATDKAGNRTMVTVMIYDGHAWEEGVVTTISTASQKGEKTYTCIHCGNTKTEEIAKLPPSIIDGQDNEWKEESSSTLTFRSDAAFGDFMGVLVDKKVIDKANYNVTEGSIIVTLKADYLATLSTGIHTIGIQSSSGTATAKFTIVSKTDGKDPTKPDHTKSPQTGDNSNTSLWIVLFFVIGGAFAIFGLKSRKRKI